MEINLVSDTVTKPSPEMLQYMFRAVVGDDVYKQDPTVIELEARVAAMFGMETGLFFPSGTMANHMPMCITMKVVEFRLIVAFLAVYWMEIEE